MYIHINVHIHININIHIHINIHIQINVMLLYPFITTKQYQNTSSLFHFQGFSQIPPPPTIIFLIPEPLHGTAIGFHPTPLPTVHNTPEPLQGTGRATAAPVPDKGQKRWRCCRCCGCICCCWTGNACSLLIPQAAPDGNLEERRQGQGEGLANAASSLRR